MVTMVTVTRQKPLLAVRCEEEGAGLTGVREDDEKPWEAPA